VTTPGTGDMIAYRRSAAGAIMIGPPGLPKIGRPVFHFRAPRPSRLRLPLRVFKWALVLYAAGVAAHFAHHMAFDLPPGTDPSLHAALVSAPVALTWPADLIGTILTST
jgi:hypothetical protein